MSAVALARDDAGVLTVTIGAGEGVNTFTAAAIAELRAELERIAADDAVRCVVLTGAGSSFVAGADVRELLALAPAARVEFNRDLLELNEAVRLLPQPTVACLNGNAFGGGLELALCCSIRVAAAGIRLGLPEAKVGLMPGSGGVVRLPRLIGYGPALRLLLSGEAIDAGRALELGLVDEVAAGDPLARAGELAAAIAANSPRAVRAIVAAVADSAALPEREAVELVHERLRDLFAAADMEEGIAAYLERRQPVFGDLGEANKEER